MVDTHIHLDDAKYDVGGVREEILGSLEQENIDFLINTSCNYKSMHSGVRLAEKYPSVYCTIGIHPSETQDFDGKTLSAMDKLYSHSKVVAVGEIGLDYYYENFDKQSQKDVFAYQIELADKYKLPITLHVRDAYGDCADILSAQRKYLNNAVVFHCFSGSAEFARQMAKKGYYFAFGGAVTFRNSRKDEVLWQIPIEQVLTETDGPYLAPEPFRGRLNKPCYVKYVLEFLAQNYNKDYADMESQILQNAKRVFTKIK